MVNRQSTTCTKRSRRGATVARAARCLLAAALSLAPHLAAAQEAIEFCFNEWRPYAYVEQGEADGVTIEVARRTSARAGFQARFTELPWNRCLEAVRREGGMHAVLDAARRDDFLQGPTSVNVYTNTFWVREDSPVERFEPPVLRGGSVGLVRGYEYPASLVRLIEDANMRIAYAKDDLGNLRLLTAGRVDFIVGDFVGTRRQAVAQGADVRPLRPDHSADRLYISFSREHADVQRAFDAALAELLAEGVVASIYERRLGIDLAELLSEP